MSASEIRLSLIIAEEKYSGEELRIIREHLYSLAFSLPIKRLTQGK